LQRKEKQNLKFRKATLQCNISLNSSNIIYFVFQSEV